MKKIKRRYILLIVFFISYFIFNIALLSNYGSNWDESEHLQRGQVYLDYFLTGNDNNFNSSPSRISIYKTFNVGKEWRNFAFWIKNDSGHPPINGIAAAFFNRVFYEKLGVLNDIESYHLFIIFVSVFLVLLIFFWNYENYGLFAGTITFLSIALYPLFLGESHFNIKDPIEASFYAATLLFFYNGIIKNSWKWIILSSIFAGLALSTKFNILFSVFTVFSWIVIYKFKEIKSLKFNVSKGIIIACLIIPFIAFGILYASWPFLWQSPVNNLLITVSYYKEIGSNILYQPERYLLFEKINTFSIQWILYTTPLVILFFTMFGIFYSLTKGFKEKNKTSLFILLWFFVSIARVSMSNTGIYGGVRQIMEYIPAMAILSGIGAKYFVGIIYGLFIKANQYSQDQRSGLKFKAFNFELDFAFCTLSFALMKKVLNKKFLQLLIILSFLPITLKLISIHPNENVYFNPLIGGLKGAKEKNIIYWGNTYGNVYRQGVEWLNKNAEKGSLVARGVAYESSIPEIWFRPDIRYSNDYQSGFEKKGEYIIEITHDMPVWSYYYYFNYAKNTLNPVYEIKVDGVVILTIWKNDWVNTKNKFKKKEEAVKVKDFKREKDSIVVDIKKEIFLNGIEIVFSNPNCNFTNEGYLVTADALKNWTNHSGSLGEIEFYKNFNPRKSKNSLLYLFPSIKTRFIKIIYSETNKCFDDIKEVNIAGI